MSFNSRVLPTGMLKIPVDVAVSTASVSPVSFSSDRMPVSTVITPLLTGPGTGQAGAAFQVERST
jgi:hypothetical protein